MIIYYKKKEIKFLSLLSRNGDNKKSIFQRTLSLRKLSHHSSSHHHLKFPTSSSLLTQHAQKIKKIAVWPHSKIERYCV